MPDPVTGAIGAVAGIGSSIIGAKGAKSAAKSQSKAADAASQAQLEMYYQSREDMAPWREAGEWALGSPGGEEFDAERYLELYPDVAADPYYGSRPLEHYQKHGKSEGRQKPMRTVAPSGLVNMLAQGPGEFTESPGYQFALSEGRRGIQNALSAMGQNRSGKHLRAATEYATGMASQEYDKFLNRWYNSLTPYQSLANVGQTGAAQTGAAAIQTGQGVARNALFRGDAQAAGTINATNALTGAITGGANQLLYYNAMRNLPQNVMASQIAAVPNYNYGYGNALSQYGVGGV